MPYSARIAVRAVCTTLGIEVLQLSQMMLSFGVGLVLCHLPLANSCMSQHGNLPLLRL